MRANSIDLIGQRFGRLIVVGISEERHPTRNKLWICKCDCGSEIKRTGVGLKRGTHNSCGCWHIGSLRHGHNMCGKRSKAYNAWANIRARSSNRNRPGAINYVSRGISMCDRWKKFLNFLEDMGEPPEKGRECQIDRIDNNLGYYKENCRWTTRTINVRNRNKTLKIEGMPLADVAEKLGIGYCRLYHLTETKGMSLGQAVLRLTT